MGGYNKRRVGSFYETAGALYLEKAGYAILARNYRNRYGEIDLIARDPAGVLVVFEVKYRSGDGYGDPLYAVDARKQRRICRTFLWYLMENRLSEDTPCRFDVLAIYKNGEIRHIRNAFDFCG